MPSCEKRAFFYPVNQVELVIAFRVSHKGLCFRGRLSYPLLDMMLVIFLLSSRALQDEDPPLLYGVASTSMRHIIDTKRLPRRLRGSFLQTGPGQVIGTFS
jgi:hypothetical protein